MIGIGLLQRDDLAVAKARVSAEQHEWQRLRTGLPCPREGCGIHSGRAYYATAGCIRTTDEATRAILRLFQRETP